MLLHQAGAACAKPVSCPGRSETGIFPKPGFGQRQGVLPLGGNGGTAMRGFAKLTVVIAHVSSAVVGGLVHVNPEAVKVQVLPDAL